MGSHIEEQRENTASLEFLDRYTKGYVKKGSGRPEKGKKWNRFLVCQETLLVHSLVSYGKSHCGATG
ncbi:hypothetical protein BaRGS_00004279, partial [Batillaria attramentaria]